MSYTKKSLVHKRLIAEIKYIKAMNKFKNLDNFYQSLVNGAKYNVMFIYKNRHSDNLNKLCQQNLKITL